MWSPRTARDSEVKWYRVLQIPDFRQLLRSTGNAKRSRDIVRRAQREDCNWDLFLASPDNDFLNCTVTARGDKKVGFLIEGLLEIVGLYRNIFGIDIRKLRGRQQAFFVDALRARGRIVKYDCKHSQPRCPSKKLFKYSDARTNSERRQS